MEYERKKKELWFYWLFFFSLILFARVWLGAFGWVWVFWFVFLNLHLTESLAIGRLSYTKAHSSLWRRPSRGCLLPVLEQRPQISSAPPSRHVRIWETSANRGLKLFPKQNCRPSSYAQLPSWLSYWVIFVLVLFVNTNILTDVWSPGWLRPRQIALASFFCTHSSSQTAGHYLPALQPQGSLPTWNSGTR